MNYSANIMQRQLVLHPRLHIGSSLYSDNMHKNIQKWQEYAYIQAEYTEIRNA